MPPDVLWQVVLTAAGAAVGAVTTGLLAAAYLRRHLARVRDAERRARAAERMAEIGAMTGGLAHEIKNPLSTIGLNAQLLAEGIDDLPIDPDDKGRLSRRVGALRREVDRLRGILTDFLQYAGKLHVQASPADLNAIVSELADFYMPQAEQQGVRLRVDLAPGPITVLVDPAQIKQAILNLLLNAVQAMAQTPVGSPRELILKTAPRGGGSRAERPDGVRGGVLSVIDTGPGIPPDTLARIFEPYFTTKSGGSGLGLPTARRIIEAHRGTLDVQTEPGKGTAFRVWLPDSEGAEGNPDRPA